MTLSKQQILFTKNVGQLIDYIFSYGYQCTLGEAYRTPEQAAIYAQSGKGILDSLHCKRLAIDINLFDANGNYLEDSSKYEVFGAYWERLDPLNRWGGKFPPPRIDGNHFERKFV